MTGNFEPIFEIESKLGGRAWHAKTRKVEKLDGNGDPTPQSPTILLGYTGAVPKSLAGTVLAEYQLELVNQAGVDASKRQQVTWMFANLVVALDPNEPEPQKILLLQACAYDDEDFYYVPFGYKGKMPVKDAKEFVEKPDVSTVTDIYRVPKALWDEPPLPWGDQRDRLDIAEAGEPGRYRIEVTQ